MSDFSEDVQRETALRNGLRGLPVPEVSADFDARIHAALSQPLPWWRTLWQNARPLLSGAVCSLILMLLLLPYLTQVRPHPGLPRGSERTDIALLERALERDDLHAASFSTLAVTHPK